MPDQKMITIINNNKRLKEKCRELEEDIKKLKEEKLELIRDRDKYFHLLMKVQKSLGGQV